MQHVQEKNYVMAQTHATYRCFLIVTHGSL